MSSGGLHRSRGRSRCARFVLPALLVGCDGSGPGGAQDSGTTVYDADDPDGRPALDAAAGEDAGRISWLSDFQVFVYGTPSADYMQELGGTTTIWSVYGGGVTGEERAYVDALHAAGLRVTANLPTMQGTAAFAGGDAERAERVACRTLEGEIARAFWIQPSPPTLPCHNNPEWRQFLAGKVVEQLEGRADGVHIDEIEGIGGHLYLAGFCEFCMSAFREYLSARFDDPELSARFDIDDVDRFDYGDVLRGLGVDLGEDPVPDRVREFVRFQLLGRRDQLEAMIAAGLAVVPSAAFSGNTVALHPLRLPQLPLLDFAVYETNLEDLPGGVNVGVHALGRALAPGRPMVLFPDILELAQLDPEDVRLVAHWYAEAVAAGQTFLVPHRAYAFGGGTYHVQAADLAPYVAWARRVRDEAEGAQPEVEGAVLYDFAAAIRDYYGGGFENPLDPGPYHTAVLEVVAALGRAHVPAGIVFSGDGDLLGQPAQSDSLAAYRWIVLVPGPPPPEAASAALDAYRASGGTVHVLSGTEPDDLATLAGEIPDGPVVTDAPATVMMLVSASRNRVVVHLVNDDWDASTHEFRPIDVGLDLAVPEGDRTVLLVRPRVPDELLEGAWQDGRLHLVVPDVAEVASVIVTLP